MTFRIAKETIMVEIKTVMASFIEEIQFVFLKLSELLKGRNVGLQNALQKNYIFSGGGGVTLSGSKQCLALPSEEKSIVQQY